MRVFAVCSIVWQDMLASMPKVICVLGIVALSHALPVLRGDAKNVLHDLEMSLLHGLTPGSKACEATLAPKFERLAVHLEEHVHEYEGSAAFEAVLAAPQST